MCYKPPAGKLLNQQFFFHDLSHAKRYRHKNVIANRIRVANSKSSDRRFDVQKFSIIHMFALSFQLEIDGPL
jgi:hypothetical protein